MNTHDSSCCMGNLYPTGTTAILSFFFFFSFFSFFLFLFLFLLFLFLFYFPFPSFFLLSVCVFLGAVELIYLFIIVLYNSLLLLQVHQSILVSKCKTLNIIKLVNSYIFQTEKQIDLFIRLCLLSQYLLILTYKC